jgi:pyruvate dehydrogenase E2 component (dihydrolipoamide acetyltransferase)
MTVFTLPDLGEGLHEAELVDWHVSVGDHVVADQPLVSVETEKAVVEIPSPHAGRIARLHGKPGDIVKVGAPLVEFEDGAAHPDVGTVLPEISEAPPTLTMSPAAASRPAGPRAAPAVRVLAERLGVDLASLTGCGPGGTVTAADVERAAAGTMSTAPLEPLRGVRRAMASNMARSHAAVVPATVTDEADIEAWPAAADATVRLVRAVGVACLAEPSLNAWFDSHGPARRLHDRVDLGIAVDTPDGLFAPVLRDVTRRSAGDLRRGLEALKHDVEARRIPIAELRGATISLSNFGAIAGRHAALVVVPPQVAILGAGRIGPRVMAIDGEPAVRRILPLSLTFDHRAVTGGEAARFLAALIADLEKPE